MISYASGVQIGQVSHECGIHGIEEDLSCLFLRGKRRRSYGIQILGLGTCGRPGGNRRV